MSLIGTIHHKYIFSRRIQRLCAALADLIPKDARVLDVGAGDGSLDKLIMQQRPDLSIHGVDVLIRPETAVPVVEFDGSHLPFANNSFDVAMFVDVLHHTTNQVQLLAEAKRVAKLVVIKDHLDEGLFSNRTLRFMDRVGNAEYGVALPYDYWTDAKWRAAFADLQLSPKSWKGKLGLYPLPLNFWFDRSLHFVTALEPAAKN